MTVYYVSPSGNDANNGLGPDASHATNKPWLTIGKALGAAGIASGDTVYIAPGTYREVVTVAMTSATAETKILGDPQNAQGFKDGGGMRLAGGEIRWSAFTVNDHTYADVSNVNLAGRDYLTFENVCFYGGNNSIVNGDTTPGSDHINLKRCAFLYRGGTGVVYLVSVADAALTAIIDSCLFLGDAFVTNIDICGERSSSADYDLNVTIRNCLFLGIGLSVAVFASGAGAYFPGGVDVQSCTMVGGDGAMKVGANMSTSIPCTIYGSAIYVADATGLSAISEGALLEDYNVIQADTPRYNVVAGAHSEEGDRTSPWGIHSGQEAIYGGSALLPGTPISDSPLFAVGDPGAPSVDMAGVPRPSGGESSGATAGACERPNTFTREVTTVKTGSNAISALGPAIQDFQLPVDATSTTVTVYTYWDATYAGTKPSMSVRMGGECGVADATDTATGAAENWEQLSLNFTPTAAGIVTIRLTSSDTNGGGKAIFDDFDVAT